MAARVFWLLLLLLPHAAQAVAAKEPTIYVFWSAEGERSRQAVAFLRSAAAADPKLSVRYFQLDQNPANTKILERIYRRIGVDGVYAVPTIFIGHNVFVGFDNPQQAGQSILKDVEQCRIEECVDLVGDLVGNGEAPQVMNNDSLRTLVVFFPADRGALGKGHVSRCAALPVDVCLEQ